MKKTTLLVAMVCKNVTGFFHANCYVNLYGAFGVHEYGFFIFFLILYFASLKDKCSCHLIIFSCENLLGR